MVRGEVASGCLCCRQQCVEQTCLLWIWFIFYYLNKTYIVGTTCFPVSPLNAFEPSTPLNPSEPQLTGQKTFGMLQGNYHHCLTGKVGVQRASAATLAASQQHIRVLPAHKIRVLKPVWPLDSGTPASCLGPQSSSKPDATIQTCDKLHIYYIQSFGWSSQRLIGLG